MRLINADALGIGKAKREAFTVPEYADGWNAAIDVIDAAPTIDIDRVAMTIFVWAWMSCFNPTQEDVNRMSDEVRNIRESVNSKNLNIWEVKDAIKDEFGWEI